ncbi:MAG: hypothetical protein K2J67_01675 [Lachnospiraceae bacterium]|nr:hypothetical protein [Lachnospiraceae bacterium]
MQERIKEVPAKFVEFWNKYTGKQKSIIIAVVCVVLLAIGLTAYFVSRPTWVKFEAFSNVDDANAMTNALDDSGIKWKASSDGMTLFVHDKDYTNALYAMSDNNLVDTGYSWDKAFDNSMSTTESEKSQKRLLALQSELRNSMLHYSFIEDADVFIDVPESTYSVIDEEGKTSVTAQIILNEKNKDQMTAETAQSLAYWLANAVGTDVENVLINDNLGTCWYNGSTQSGLGGYIAGGVDEYCEKLRSTIASNVTDLLVALDYNEVKVGTQGIQFNLDMAERVSKTYSVDEGREYGYPTKLYTYESEGSNGAGGEPGTGSNDDDTDTVINAGSTYGSSVNIEKLEGLLTNETIENIKHETPTIETDQSSIGIVVLRYQVYDEEQLEADGTLDNMTFDEFMAANSERTAVTLPDEHMQMLSNATGVDVSRISVVAYQVPKFVEKTRSSRGIQDYLMIILAVLIIALLIFVVLRGTAPVKVTDEEPELSVEQLLATTKENQSLEDIEFSDKSETRKLIEKFVDENPEAVAQLLRNWLNDDWN